MNEVSAKTAAITMAIIPVIPVIISAKYNPINAAATINLTALSVDPIFFFIMMIFC